MLYITRKPGESIIINNSIIITIDEIKGKNVKIGCTSPNDTSILRKELYDKITAANMEALQVTDLSKIEVQK
jgi:carbon storage regulator